MTYKYTEYNFIVGFWKHLSGHTKLRKVFFYFGFKSALTHFNENKNLLSCCVISCLWTNCADPKLQSVLIALKMDVNWKAYFYPLISRSNPDVLGKIQYQPASRCLWVYDMYSKKRSTLKDAN